MTPRDPGRSRPPRAGRHATSGRLPPGLALLLFPPILALAAAVVAVMLAPPLLGLDIGVRRFSERLRAEGATFRRLPRPPERSVIYARDGTTVLATVYLDENRETVDLQHVSPVARKAVLAIEDRGFYQHGALNAASVLRAFLANVVSGQIVQGGSTITQQLVKNTLIDTPRETYARKLQEAGLAIRMEQKYSKDQIFQMYLNEVYFGHGVYGIGTAAQYYFSRPASKLTTVQAATLAGMIASPETFDPLDHPRAAKRRRNEVLRAMTEAGWASSGRVKHLRGEPIRLGSGAGSRPNETLPFFVRFLQDEILDESNSEFDAFGKTYEQRAHTLFQGGLRIVTTLDPAWQATAQRVAQAHLHGPPDASVVSLDAKTGAIRTMLSGKDFARDELNLATAARQPGSAFKPYTLVAAFRQRIPPTSRFTSKSPLHLSRWDNACHCVTNAEGASDRGMIDLWEATADSVNVVFAQLALMVGPDRIARAAHDMGIERDLLPVPSITLGADAVSPLDMASGYQTLADQGVHCEPFAVSRVTDSEGVLYHHQASCKQAIPKDVANLVTAMLQGVVDHGTGTSAALGRPVAGKTGTTQEATDVWFVGYTPQVSTSVWVGLPGNPSPMDAYFPGSVYGGTIAAPIWHDYMARVTAGMPVQGFPPAPKIEPRSARVPDVVGLSESGAIDKLQEARFGASAKQVPSSKPKGTVVGQSPRAGATADEGSVVNLQVSSGRPPGVLVPDVVGMSGPDARAVLRAKGLTVTVSTQDVTQQDKDGIVLAQSPAGGERVDPDTTVRLTVGRKPTGGQGGGG